LKSQRYVARDMCSVENPDATRTWFVVDRTMGVPLADENGIRYFTKDEVKAFLSAQIQANVGFASSRT
jgi:hypothetical protein